MRPYVLLWRGEPLQRVQGRRKQQRIFGTLRIKGKIGQGPNGGGPKDREHGTGGEGGCKWVRVDQAEGNGSEKTGRICQPHTCTFSGKREYFQYVGSIFAK